jgi:predicted transcriptional regulator
MSEQLKLEPRFAPKENVGAPYAKGSDTSKAAAKKVASKVAEQQTDVYRAIVRSGEHGKTWDEIATELDLCATANGRVTALVEMGLVIDSGRRRNTRRGRAATVWIASPAKETQCAE